jgi:glucose-6-phosphate-specific signal transduction histidine kinase
MNNIIDIPIYMAALYKGWQNGSLVSLTNSIQVIFNSKLINFHLQSWGDHADISQAVAMYIVEAVSVCLYCWFGNELSEQVRKIVF